MLLDLQQAGCSDCCPGEPVQRQVSNQRLSTLVMQVKLIDALGKITISVSTGSKSKIKKMFLHRPAVFFQLSRTHSVLRRTLCRHSYPSVQYVSALTILKIRVKAGLKTGETKQEVTKTHSNMSL